MRKPDRLPGFIAAIALFAPMLAVPGASAQDVRSEVTRAVDEIRKTNQTVAVQIDRDTGLPTSMKGLTPRPDPSVALTATRSLTGEPSEEDVRRAVEAFMATSSDPLCLPARQRAGAQGCHAGATRSRYQGSERCPRDAAPQ